MKLDEARRHVGERVVYKTPTGNRTEDGTISHVSDEYVFVLYDGDLYSKATTATCLTLMEVE